MYKNIGCFLQMTLTRAWPGSGNEEAEMCTIYCTRKKKALLLIKGLAGNICGKCIMKYCGTLSLLEIYLMVGKKKKKLDEHGNRF